MKKFLSTILAASLMLLGTTAFAQMSVNAGYINSTRTAKASKSATWEVGFPMLSAKMLISFRSRSAYGLAAWYISSRNPDNSSGVLHIRLLSTYWQ